MPGSPTCSPDAPGTPALFPFRRPLTSGSEEVDSKLMRFSALVGDRLLGLLQLLGPSDSLRPFSCRKQRATVSSWDNWELVSSAAQHGQKLLSPKGAGLS